MFDFFEVPSSAFGSIGPVAQGQNFDWSRDDRRPGQINLNLIIDEEVFLGLIDDPRLNSNPLFTQVLPPIPVYPPTAPVALLPVTAIPQVVTQVNSAGAPTVHTPTGISDGQGFYSVNNRGYLGQFPVTGNPASSTFPMHQAFADFLKVRHGGSGFLFAWGSGAVNAPNVGFPANTPPINADPRVAAERPFHSPSFPDINYTIMRPATLPPSLYTSFVDITNTVTPDLITPNLHNFITVNDNLWGFGQQPVAVTLPNGSTSMLLQPYPPSPPATTDAAHRRGLGDQPLGRHDGPRAAEPLPLRSQ